MFKIMISYYYYLFIYLFIYLFFASRFSAFCFSAPNQNVSRDILDALGGLDHIRSFFKSLLPLQSLHVVYLNFTVCIFNRID